MKYIIDKESKADEGLVVVKFVNDDGEVKEIKEYRSITDYKDIYDDILNNKVMNISNCFLDGFDINNFLEYVDLNNIFIKNDTMKFSIKADESFINGCLNFSLSKQEYKDNKMTINLQKVDFIKSVFMKEVVLNNTIFHDTVNFSMSTYEGDVDFSCCTYKDKATFFYSSYKGKASFLDSTYEKVVIFSKSHYLGNAYFDSSTYKGTVYFSDSVYDGYAYYFGSQFYEDVNCQQSLFRGNADFSKSKYKMTTYFADSHFEENANFENSIYQRIANFSRSTFTNQANFSESIFLEKAEFNNLIKPKTVSFKNTKFYGECFFSVNDKSNDSAINIINIRFYDIFKNNWIDSEIKYMIYNQEDTSNKEKAAQFLTLKQTYNKQGLYDYEDEAYVEFKRCQEEELIESKLNQIDFNENKAKIEMLLFPIALTRIMLILLFSLIGRIVFDYIGGYGTKPKNVFRAMIVTLILFATYYCFPFAGFFNTFSIKNFPDSFYFSLITFLTIGYGDIHPTTLCTKLVAGCEGFIGLFLMSYFTVAFTRKILR